VGPFEHQNARIILTSVTMIIETAGVFPVLSTHVTVKLNNDSKLQKKLLCAYLHQQWMKVQT
jgi:hypothetical protein